MKVNGIPTRSIRSLDGGTAVEIVDQTSLPYHYETRVLNDWRDCVEAIANMRVRGAPLIGITGASCSPRRKTRKTPLCLRRPTPLPTRARRP